MELTIDRANVAEAFSALGSQPRLELMHILMNRGQAGLYVGDLSQRSGITGSTLTHHLAALVEAGLVTRVKQGRRIQCVVNSDRLRTLSAYLLGEC